MTAALADLYEGWRAALIAGAGPGRSSDRFFRRRRGRNGIRCRQSGGIGNMRSKYKYIWTIPAAAKRCAKACGWPLSARPMPAKVSLINALARRDVAIVSQTPGTTRDVIEVRLDLGGYPCRSPIRRACARPQTRSKRKGCAGRGRKRPPGI